MSAIPDTMLTNDLNRDKLTIAACGNNIVSGFYVPLRLMPSAAGSLCAAVRQRPSKSRAKTFRNIRNTAQTHRSAASNRLKNIERSVFMRRIETLIIIRQVQYGKTHRTGRVHGGKKEGAV